jgi:hypothetical protein
LNPADFAEGTAKVQLSSGIPNPSAKIFDARRAYTLARAACYPCAKVAPSNMSSHKKPHHQNHILAPDSLRSALAAFGWQPNY